MKPVVKWARLGLLERVLKTILSVQSVAEQQSLLAMQTIRLGFELRIVLA